MNSMSKRNYEYSKKEDRYEHCRKEERYEEKKCESFVKCGFPRETTIPAATAVNTTFTLTTLNLDSSCICDPRIKLDFAANFITTGFTGALSIQVLKQCRNQVVATPVGPSWNYNVTTTAITQGQAFEFFICDEDICSGDCCTYTVVATVTTATGEASTLLINNATLAATVTCGENQCHKRCNCHN